MKKLQDYNRMIRSSRKIPKLQAGDIVKIHRNIKEGGKERTQVFEGIVIAIKGKQSSSPMVTVRKVSFGVGVEITVPILSPAVEKIEVVKRAKTKKAKLYYLRRKDFKLSKLKIKELDQFVAEPARIASQGDTGGEEKVESAPAEEAEKPNSDEKDIVKDKNAGQAG